jgi:hypothetical protein
VVVRPESYGAVGDNVTDDSAAIENAISAAVDACIADLSFECTVQFDPRKTYLCSRALQQGGAGLWNAQVRLPWRTPTSKVVLRLRGGQNPQWAYPVLSAYNQSSGATIRSSLAPAWSGTYGVPSCIGGPTYTQLTGATTFSLLQVVVENLRFRAPDNPSITMLDLSKVYAAEIDGVGFDTNVALSSISQPTSPTGLAYLLPQVNNNIMLRTNRVSVVGYFGGHDIVEHVQHGWIASSRCAVASFFRQPGDHAKLIQNFDDEGNIYGLATIDPSAGLVGTPVCNLQILNWQIEGAASGWQTRVNDVRDPTNALVGRFSYYKSTGALQLSGAAGCQFFDLHLTSQQQGIRKLLAYHAYNSLTGTSHAGDTSFVDVDATNAAVTFIVPSSGKVLIEVEAPEASYGNAAQVGSGYWGLRESTTDVSSGGLYMSAAQGVAAGAAIYTRKRASFTIIGLTPGDTHTYKWSIKVDDAVDGVTEAVLKQLTMQVFEIP